MYANVYIFQYNMVYMCLFVYRYILCEIRFELWALVDLFVLILVSSFPSRTKSWVMREFKYIKRNACFQIPFWFKDSILEVFWMDKYTNSHFLFIMSYYSQLDWNGLITKRMPPRNFLCDQHVWHCWDRLLQIMDWFFNFPYFSCCDKLWSCNFMLIYFYYYYFLFEHLNTQYKLKLCICYSKKFKTNPFYLHRN